MLWKTQVVQVIEEKGEVDPDKKKKSSYH
jgi:hypothetical protein